MKKKRVFQILGVIVVCGAAAGGIAFAAGGSASKVNVSEIGTGTVTQTVEAEGHIESEEEKTYYAAVSAIVSEFSAKAGDVVQAGDLLVVYDTEDFDREVEQARLEAAALEAGYQGSAAQSAELTNAYNEAAAQDAAYQEIYQAVLTNVNDLQYDIEVVADAVNDDYKELEIKIADVQVQIAAKNAAAQDDSYDEEERSDFLLEAAQLQIELASLQKKQAELADTGAEPIQNRYFSEADMFLNEVATQRSILQQEMLSTRHAAMNAAQLEQLSLNAELADTAATWSEEEAAKAGAGVVTELTGVISDIMIDEGAYVAEGSPLFTVKDTQNVKAVVEVTSYEMADIALGQRATVKIGSASYEGEVSRIRMETVTDAQNNAKLEVEIHIENPDGKIYLGTDVDASIETGASDACVFIPNTALYADDGGDYCYLIEDGVVAKRYISCGLDSGSNTEVTEGLNGGELVITDAMTDDSIGNRVVAK